MYLNVGEVPTSFHLLKLKITTEKQRMENVDKNILEQEEEAAEPLQVGAVRRDGPEESQDMNVEAQTLFCGTFFFFGDVSSRKKPLLFHCV